MPPDYLPSESANYLARNICDLHADVRYKIALRNENYKLDVDVHCRNNECDYIIVCIRSK